MVKFTLHRPGSSDHLYLTAVSYPTICSTLPSITGVSNYTHLAGLELADKPVCRGEDSSSIDILIGSDHYWKFVTGEMRRGNQGPVAIQSKLGWLLSGSIGLYEDAKQTHTHLMLTRECFSGSHEPLQHVLRTFRETESIGITEGNPEV